jgi:hypothetical protein
LTNCSAASFDSISSFFMSIFPLKPFVPNKL